MDVEHVRAILLLVAGLGIGGFGLRVAVLGRLVIRKPRRQDSVALQKSSVLEGGRARQRGVLLATVGTAMVLGGLYLLLA